MIEYTVGDAINPKTFGNKVICHVCNDIGKWGKGFVVALSRRWSEPEAMYRSLKKYRLGDTQFVKVEDDTWVANMIAQRGVYRKRGVPPIRYTSLTECLVDVNDFCKEHNATLHMPRIGCGLAGGKWHRVEQIINDCCVDVPGIFVYDLPKR